MLATQAAVACFIGFRVRVEEKRRKKKKKKKKKGGVAKNKKITAQSIPMWSPTIVLTLPSSV
jgi:hypothetical protein